MLNTFDMRDNNSGKEQGVGSRPSTPQRTKLKSYILEAVSGIAVTLLAVVMVHFILSSNKGSTLEEAGTLGPTASVADTDSATTQPEAKDVAAVAPVSQTPKEETQVNNSEASEAKALAKAKAEKEAKAKAEKEAEAKAKAEAEARAKAAQQNQWQSTIQSRARACPIQIRTGVRLTSITYTSSSVTFHVKYDEISKYDRSNYSSADLDQDRATVISKYGSGIPATVRRTVVQVDRGGRTL